MLVALLSAVVCDPPARGSLAFVVAVVGIVMHMRHILDTCFFVAAVFYKALVSVHQSGVCVPVHLTVFVPAAAPVHALS